MRFSACMEGHSRRLWPTPSTTPARRHASIIALASRTLSASGFSQNTCLPAAAAASTIGRCSECGVTTTTALMPGSASTSAKSVVSGSAWRAANSRTFSGAASTPRTKRMRSLFA